MQRFRFDLRSKFTDGIMTGLILFILIFFLALIYRPILMMFDKPGILIYTLFATTAAVLCLNHSLHTRLPETTRSWYGMVGGTLAWLAVELANFLGGQSLSGATGILMLIMVGLMSGMLWRKIMPLGIRLFMTVILLNWTGHVVFADLVKFSPRIPFLVGFQPYLGWAAILGGLITLGYILFYTEKRQERLGASLWLCFFMVFAVYAFRGGMF
jgi:hypothetical protein